MRSSKVLTDADHDISVKSWEISSDGVGDKADPANWSVTKRTLSGGRQEGVEIIDVDNGAMTFTVVPTRGLNVWTAAVGDLRLGWDSPVKEIVHPQFVNLTARGGCGWHDGFGEWISRCGLESFGPPCKDGERFLTLHGRVNYIPASFVEVLYEQLPTPRILIRGTVNETLMFGPQLRLMTEIATEIGKPALTLSDTVTNLGAGPQEWQTLYHINFGTPLVSEGAEFIAPVKRVAPRDSRAAENMSRWNAYEGPHPVGYREEVYLMELYADHRGNTETLLRSADGSQGALVSYNVQELPFMVLWKNEGPLKDGYVNGVEPATGFPYPAPSERTAGRVPRIDAGETYHMQVTITALTSRDEIQDAVSRISSLQQTDPEVAKTPIYAV